MQLVTKDVKDLTSSEYRACYRANFGINGLMQYDLVTARKFGGRDVKAVMLWDGPTERIGSLVGWALMYRQHDLMTVQMTKAQSQKCKYAAQFYIKRQYRRRGYGKQLMAGVKNITERPFVVPHDEKSGEFFSNFKVSADSYGRAYYMKYKKDRI